MALRIVDLTQVDDGTQPVMTHDEYRAELAKPRAEREGLTPIPVEMSMTREDEMRFVASVRRHHQEGMAAKSRAWADGRNSNCL